VHRREEKKMRRRRRRRRHVCYEMRDSSFFIGVFYQIFNQQIIKY
jgi:hypothetical protein